MQELTTSGDKGCWSGATIPHYLHTSTCKNVVLLVFTMLLLLGSVLVSQNQSDAYAANPGVGNACLWYKIRSGDTLGRIARSNRLTIQTLAYANNIRNSNLIFTGHNLCIPYAKGTSPTRGQGGSGVLANGYVLWFAYSALGWSTRGEVSALLRQAAAHYGLPANLLLAISWQESTWNQHVIARDGGIGAMQIMPYTAMVLNAMTGVRRDPYKLWDNINLGALFLRTLWVYFRGNLIKVISAYNEGGWNVVHRGILNWGYVNNVITLMRRMR